MSATGFGTQIEDMIREIGHWDSIKSQNGPSSMAPIKRHETRLKS